MGCCASKVELMVEEVTQQDPTGGLSEFYEVKHLLGSGSAGDTWLCRDKVTGEVLAVKLMKRPIPPAMGTTIMREVKIGAQLGKGHLNIVKPKEVVLTRTHLGLIMEYVAGGNMADYILKTILLKFGSFDTRDGLVMEEDEARYFFMQIISAVDFCHRNKVAHRDLKMDNTLLDDGDPPQIKLCDFGFANWWREAPQMQTIMGTPDYMSPQLLGAKAVNTAATYDGTKADIWAAGVMLCVMLIGRFPFEGTDMATATNIEELSRHVFNQICSGRWYDNPLIAQDCQLLSVECVDLLNRMFELDEAKRITIPDIQKHPWFCKPLPSPYLEAWERQLEEQRKMYLQVASGVFVNKDRDRTLKEIIYLSATRYDVEQETFMVKGVVNEDNSMLRRVSLNSIKPYQYESQHHMDLTTISNFFKANSPDGLGDLATPDNSTHNSTAAKAALAALEAEAILKQHQVQQQQQGQGRDQPPGEGQQQVSRAEAPGQERLNGAQKEQDGHVEQQQQQPVAPGPPLSQADPQQQQQQQQRHLTPAVSPEIETAAS